MRLWLSTSNNKNIKSALANNKLKPVAKTNDELSEPPSEIPPLEPRAEISQPLLSKKGFIFVIVGVVVVALIVGVIWVVVRLPKKAPVVAPVTAPVTQPEIIPPPAESEVVPVPEVVTPPVEVSAPVITVEPTADTDNDGLTDTEEATAGTNAQVPDTDTDGLSDYEEITLWKTNPLNPDTDGDGYNDGQEVTCAVDGTDQFFWCFSSCFTNKAGASTNTARHAATSFFQNAKIHCNSRHCCFCDNY
ncbi:MAG: hypothetical protein UV20_C0032G0003 [Candidatus Magasanikbacteria bacterium GW2011_GWA2_42_32]|uniref:Uncharacterized protein n=1 Tax=Candidatus Magasanikbacteria bacterium GW2011_GWA2_42_32 TaxID=1619039 RepID=A0A0G1A0P9_9BACT|nr:MAG: hypothetical protein UV20_C0032G0003 [Candidatus Magasanikbacteria bacterium GW2011_GWA2_42_32]